MIQIVLIQQGFVVNKVPDSIPGTQDLSVSFLGPSVLIASLWQQYKNFTIILVKRIPVKSLLFCTFIYTYVECLKYVY